MMSRSPARSSAASYAIAAFIALFTAASAPAHAQAGNEILTHTGQFAPGTVSVTQNGAVYSLRFTGDEVIEYQLDFGHLNVDKGLIQIYELSSDTWPIFDGQLGYQDASGVHSIGWMSPYRTMTGVSSTQDSVIVNFVDVPPGDPSGVRHIRYTYTLTGKTLRLRVQDVDQVTRYSNNYMGVLVTSTNGLENPKYLKLQGALATPIVMTRGNGSHWYIANMLDVFNTNASDFIQTQNPIRPLATTTSVDFNWNTWSAYEATTPGCDEKSGALDDTFVVTVSSRLQDVFATPNTGPSPYRELLENRLVMLLPNTNWADYPPLFDLFDSWGMDNLAGYFFSDWSQSANDWPTQSNLGPDWFPAKNPTAFAAAVARGRAKGFPLAAYTIFNTMPTSAPASVYDASHIARNCAGSPNLHYEYGVPLISASASAIHAARESNLLKSNYGLNSGYLDVMSYGPVAHGSEGDHVDQSANGTSWGRTLSQALRDQRTWMRGMQDTFEGPLLGESSIATAGANFEFLWAGVCDSTQRVINSGSGLSASNTPIPRAYSQNAPTQWPVIVDYEWRVFSRLQANHGNGIFERFFGPIDGPNFVDASGNAIYPMTEPMLDRYRLYEITYGKTGYFQVNGAFNLAGNYLLFADYLKEYYMTNALQALYMESAPTQIQYLYNGQLLTFDDIFFQTETTNTFRHPRIRLAFPNGLEIYLNHNQVPWNVTVGNVSYVIPEDGFVARRRGTQFLCFSAIPPSTGGQRIDYCNAPNEYEFFDGRGAVSGYGNLTTPYNRVAFKSLTRNTIGRENPAQSIDLTSAGPAPTITRINVQPPLATLSLGSAQRKGFHAVATYSNGAVRDVTKLVTWSSSLPAIASVNQGAAVTAAVPGAATITVSTLQGAPVVPAVVTVLP